MKAVIGGTIAALALALAGCGGDGAGNGQAAQNVPLKQIPAPNGGDWSQVVAKTPEGGHVMGNPNAPVKLVEFGSMTCGHCATFSKEGEPQLVERYVKSGQVSFEFRNFVRDPADIAAALLARCSGPNGFFPLTDQLFAAQEEWLAKLQQMPPAQQQQIQSMSPNQAAATYAGAAGMVDFVRVRGIPSGRAQACLADSGELQRLVGQATKDGNEHQVRGTPSFLINGKLVEASAWKELEPLLQAALR
jgi:protein-disulfide isomerase